MNSENGAAGHKEGQTQRKPMQFPYVSFFIIWALLSLLWWWVMSLQGACIWTKPEAIGALFSGWAFVAMFFALRTQSAELALQREELEDTRKELRRTATANEESAKLAQKNVRAQYLMFWIERNEKQFCTAKDKSKIAKEGYVEYMNKFNDEEFLQNEDEFKNVAIWESAMKSNDEFISKYESYRDELDNLTKVLIAHMQ